MLLVSGRPTPLHPGSGAPGTTSLEGGTQGGTVDAPWAQVPYRYYPLGTRAAARRRRWPARHAWPTAPRTWLPAAAERRAGRGGAGSQVAARLRRSPPERVDTTWPGRAAAAGLTHTLGRAAHASPSPQYLYLSTSGIPLSRSLA